MIPVNDEKYELKIYPRIQNSAYLWSDTPSAIFKGRPASQMEIKKYRIQKGVNGGSDSVFIKCTNLPQDIGPSDKVVFLGKEWQVQSIGYYYDEARFINAGCLSDEAIIARCPKGLNLQ